MTATQTATKKPFVTGTLARTYTPTPTRTGTQTPTSTRTPMNTPSAVPTRTPVTPTATPTSVITSVETWRFYYYAGSARIAVREKKEGSNQLYFLLTDHLGGTSKTVNTSGQVVAELRYTAFGETWYGSGDGDPKTPTSLRYTGQREYEDLKLYFYQSRFYDPLTAHFVSADTIIPNPGLSIAYDRYAYVLWNPINFMDPSGHKACDGENLGGSCDTLPPPVHVVVPAYLRKTNEEARRYEKLANDPSIQAQYRGGFTVMNYFEYLANSEIGEIPPAIAPEIALKELIARDFYEHCDGYCNPNSDIDLLRYIAIKQMNSGGERNLTADNFDMNKVIKHMFKEAITNPDKPEWKTGCDRGDVVCNWGNPYKMLRQYISEGKANNGAKQRLDMALGYYEPMSTARNTVYLKYGSGDNVWVAWTANQSACIYLGTLFTGGSCQ